MKRQILSILLTFCMVLALLPTVALAEEAGAGGSGSGTQTSLTSKTLANYLEGVYLKAGSYQLDENLNIENTLYVKNKVTLDLNGNTLTKTTKGGSVIFISDTGGELTLKDSGNGGKITASQKIDDCVYVKGTFNMEGGTIQGFTASNGSASNGRGVYVYQGGTFNMTGGTIEGCKDKSANSGGGGVCVEMNGTFTMTGGTIKNCTAYNGGGVYVFSGGIFNMEDGGIIADCTAENGGGVYVGNSNNKGGTFNMTGGKIQNCTATEPTNIRTAFGGGVYVKGTFHMTGGSIENCTATATAGNSTYGGGVYVNEDGAFTMEGGIIKDCTATAKGQSVNGGGINNKGTTILSGSAEIQGCKVENDPKANRELGGGIYSVSSGSITIQGNVKVSGCSGSVNGKSDAMYLEANSSNSISDGTFDGSVTNRGKITGGEFKGEVTNNGGTISGGNFTGNVTNKGSKGVIQNGENGNIPTFSGTVTNQKTISGGKFTGTVTNNGTISSGNFTGTVTNESTGNITGGTFEQIKNKSSEKIDTTKVNCKNISEEGGGATPAPKTFTVTFNTNGGSSVAPKEIEEGQTVPKPDAPTKDKCTFGGWYKDEKFTEPYNFETLVTKDITLYAKWTAKDPASGGSSGSGSSGGSSGGSSSGSHSSSGSSSSKNSYSVSATTGKTQNGSASVSSKNATEGERVTITVHPEKGYTLDKLSVLDKNGKEIKLKDNGDGTFTFTMPASKVDIQPVFKEAVSEPAPPTVENNQSAKPKKTVVQMQVGSKQLISNGEVSTKNAAPIIRNDRTLVPIRFITEALGGDVKWNEKTKEVILVIDGKEIKMEIGKSLEKYNVAPILVNDRTYVPVRFVADELQATVSWLDATKTVTIVKDAVEK